tara:strand:+ start:2775 stop:3095 length:321 start_codon:yes stop_codon:yes gene_type:complete
MTEALARTTDPDTSKESAKSLDPTKLEAKVLEIIKEFPNGVISEKVEDIMWERYRIKASSVTPRYRRLFDKDHIFYAGKEVARSGRQQTIMCAVVTGIAQELADSK